MILCQLHQYPGYDPSELTPLPNGFSATQILSKVVNAQPKLKNKPQYLPEFERLFYSQMSQAILQVKLFFKKKCRFFLGFHDPYHLVLLYVTLF